jgi:hypothetical protein
MTTATKMSNEEREMRRSFRIRESAHVRYEVLEPEDYISIVENRALKLPTRFGSHARLSGLEAQFQEQFALMGKAALPVRECLRVLNDKLNLLLDEQPDRQAQLRALTEHNARTCEIGALGMRFDVGEEIPMGGKLFVQALFTSDRHYLETPAVVRNITKPLNPDADGVIGSVGVEFVGITEAETELLIKHLFQRESESLRMRRLSMDED